MENNLPSDVEESTRELLGKRLEGCYKRMVRLEVKADKYEPKILVLTEYRVFLLTAKVPTKVEYNIPYLDIQTIESKKHNQLTLVTDGKRLVLTTGDTDSATADVDHMINYMISACQDAFPTVPIDRLLKVDASPAERQQHLMERVKQISLREAGPCGGFSATYAAMCDYHSLPFLEEVAWDVDTIYLSQDSKELNLGDFDHLGTKHLIPIVAALQYNSWFTGLNANNVRLTTEAANEILQVVKKNKVLEELRVSGVGAKWEFAHKLAMAILQNTHSQLTTLDLADNPIEDRGLNHLSVPLGKLQRGLSYLNLSHTGITAKGINRLAESLAVNKVVHSALTFLDLSDNPVKGEELTNLFNFLAHPNVLTTLRMSGTECALQNLFGSLSKGCCDHLANLDLSHNVFTHKRTKDVNVPVAWKQFFISAKSLKTVNLSDTKLTTEALKNLLLGVSINKDVTDLDLDLSSNNLRTPGAEILQNVLPEVCNITALNISDNGFDHEMAALCCKISRNQSIRRLAIGRNFSNIKAKHLAQVLDSVVQMIQEENSVIEALSLADSQLKNDTTIIINALGSNSSLGEVDLRGNTMGDVGARMLAKALQINTNLHTIYWDRNSTTALGFSDVANALTRNYNVKKMPSPIVDAAVALKLHGDKTIAALQKIEDVLKRNHSPRKVASDQGYRLHQGFLISSSQQMLDRLVVQVQDHIATLEKGGRNLTEDMKNDIRSATCLVADANATKQVLPRLQQVALQVEDEGNIIDTKLGSLSTDLQNVMELQLKRTVKDMLKCAEDQCPTVMDEEDFRRELHSTSLEKSVISPTYTKSILIDQVSTDVMNKVSQLNLAVAAHMSDRLIDGVLDSLDDCHKRLTNHINSADPAVSGEFAAGVRSTPARPGSLPSTAVITAAAKDKARIQPCEDDVFDEAAAQSTIKRKSLYSRRLRPQSVIDAADVKKALKLAESMSSNGGSGHVKEEEEEEMEEEHESEAPKVADGRTTDKVAKATKNVVAMTTENVIDREEGMVAGVVVVNVAHSVVETDNGPQVKADSEVMVIADKVKADFLAELTAGIEAGRNAQGEGQGSEGDEDTEGRRPSKDLSPIVQSPSTPKSPSLSLKSTSSMSDVSLPAFDMDAPKLEHLVKSRPKRAKTRAISRVALRSDRSTEDISESVDSGVHEFFERKEVVKEYSEVKVKLEDKEKGDEEKKDDGKKKGWSPFGVKADAKGLAAGISSFFAKREKPSPNRSPESSRKLVPRDEEPVRQSPEPARRTSMGLTRSPTPEKRRPAQEVATRDEVNTALTSSLNDDREEDKDRRQEEDKDTPPWKRGYGMPGVPGLSGSAGVRRSSGGSSTSALVAEMKAKRVSMQPQPKTEDKENKENVKENNRSPLIASPATGKDKNAIIPPSAPGKDSRFGPTPALRPAPGQSLSAPRPVPAPRSSSPGVPGEKTVERSDDSSGSTPSPPSRTKPGSSSKPRPPPIAPKPRSKPVPIPAPAVAKPNIITTSRSTGITGRMSESIGEKASPPASGSPDNSKDDADPPRMMARRRSSVKERVAFLDKNRNEQPADNLARLGGGLSKDGPSVSKVTDAVPQRSRSMYVGAGSQKDDALAAAIHAQLEDLQPLQPRRRASEGGGERPLEATGNGTDQTNGSATDGENEFVLFL